VSKLPWRSSLLARTSESGLESQDPAGARFWGLQAINVDIEHRSAWAATYTREGCHGTVGPLTCHSVAPGSDVVMAARLRASPPGSPTYQTHVRNVDVGPVPHTDAHRVI
jgi:hypothetical protein